MKHSFNNQKRIVYFFASLCLCIFFVSCATHRRSALSRRLFVKAEKHQRKSDFYASNRSVKNQQHNNFSKNHFTPIEKQVDAPQISENEQDVVQYETNFHEETSNFEKKELSNNQQIVVPIHKLDKKNRGKKEKPKSEKFRLAALWLFLSSISLAGISMLFLLVFVSAITSVVLIIVGFLASLVAFFVSIRAFHHIHRETTDKEIKRKFYGKAIPVMVFAGLFCFVLIFLLAIASFSL